MGNTQNVTCPVTTVTKKVDLFVNGQIEKAENGYGRDYHLTLFIIMAVDL